MKYNLLDIPELDPAEFDLYREARRTGEYFFQKIENGILDLRCTSGWIPIGQTSNSRILLSSNVSSDIAIMYQWEDMPEEMVWFHLSIIE